MRSFESGGIVSDYWKEVRRVKTERPIKEPYKVIQQIKRALNIIIQLKPTCKEIIEYSENLYQKNDEYRVVTVQNVKDIFLPSSIIPIGKNMGEEPILILGTVAII